MSKNYVLIARRQVDIQEHFCSLTNRIFQFKFWCWLSSPLKCTIDSDIKVLNHVFLTLASDHDEQKTKPSYKIFLKNKLAESTDHEAGMSDATSTEVWSQNSDEGSGSKAEMSKFHDVWNSGFCGSFMIQVTTLCIVMFAES